MLLQQVPLRVIRLAGQGVQVHRQQAERGERVFPRRVDGHAVFIHWQQRDAQVRERSVRDARCCAIEAKITREFQNAIVPVGTEIRRDAARRGILQARGIVLIVSSRDVINGYEIQFRIGVQLRKVAPVVDGGVIAAIGQALGRQRELNTEVLTHIGKRGFRSTGLQHP